MTQMVLDGVDMCSGGCLGAGVLGWVAWVGGIAWMFKNINFISEPVYHG